MPDDEANTASPFSQLNPRQQQFVIHYLNHFNGTRAYKEAGYRVRSEGTAWTGASRLLRNVKVAAAVRELLREHGITREAVMCRYAEIFFGADLADFQGFLQGKTTLVELRRAGRDTRMVKAATIHSQGRDSEVRKLELLDALAAGRELGRVLGIVSEGRDVRHGGTIGLKPGGDLTQEELMARAQASAPDDRWLAEEGQETASGNDQTTTPNP